jgi:CHASE3 domain sensor protein
VTPDIRTWAAAGTFLAILSVGVLIAVLFFSRLGADAADLTERQVRYTTALSAAALNAKGIANDERGYLLSGSEEFLIEIDVRTGVARDAFADAAEAAGGEQKERILAAYEAFERWLAALDEDIALFQSGAREEAMAASLGPTRELRKDYEAMLSTTAMTQSGVPSATASVSAAATWAIVALLAYLGVATAVVLVVTAWATSGRWPGRS